jgi:glutaredoxin/cytochrome c biogenesis protein CcdA
MTKRIIFLFFAFVLLLSSGSVFAQSAEIVGINFFYSQTCPHCKAEKEFLNSLKEKYPEIKINEYEVINSKENQEILKTFYERYNIPKGEQGYVPVTFTSEKYFIGFNEQTGKELEGCIRECLGQEGQTGQKVKFFFFGEIDISKMSLPALAIVLGALDGFNPCAMWVLLFLIALLINTRSRKRMWLVGGTFLLVSGVIYFLILSAWLNLFFAISYVSITRIIIGAFSLIFGLWQIRTFFTQKPGVCKVTGGNASWQDRLENFFQNKAKNLAVAPLSIGIVLGIVVLAFGINLVDFFCSAGLPAVFTKVLSMSNLNAFSYYAYLLLYTFVFMLDDLVVFIVAMITLRRVNLTEKYSHWAVLIGGLLIFVLGILLIFKPEILMFS